MGRIPAVHREHGGADPNRTVITEGRCGLSRPALRDHGIPTER